jgi:hypothetical protein
MTLLAPLGLTSMLYIEPLPRLLLYTKHAPLLSLILLDLSPLYIVASRPPIDR